MKNWMKIFLRSLLCLSITVAGFTSCLDDVWEKIDDIENRLDELEAELTSQVEAMNAILSNGATLTSCVKGVDGSYTITLSNGTKFKVLPEGTNFSSLVTYMVKDGKKCWATYDPSGNPVLITDTTGNPIPVGNDIKVSVENGIYYLVINGKKYMTSYDDKDVVQVFSSCTPLTDASGNIYAVKFTFGPGQEITVMFDGFKGVVFKLSSLNNEVVTEYFIDYGKSQSFLLEMSGVIDYVPQVPDGWRIKEYTEELTGETYLKVTAPSKELVAMGAAVSEGWLKVVSVVEGNKAAVSKMYLSTEAFKAYNVTPLKAVVTPYFGIQKFAYGMMFAEDFNEDEVYENVCGLISSNKELPAGYYISTDPIEKFVTEVFPGEMPVDRSYVFWAIPALYNDDEADAGFFAVKEMMRTKVLAPISVSMTVGNETVLDADAKVSVSGAESVYAGVAEVTESYLSEIVYQINNGILTPGTKALSFDGKASQFPSKDEAAVLDPATEYALWIVPVIEGKETYAVSDIIQKKFSTKSVAAGGSIETAVGDFTVTASTMTTKISAENAAMIYYAYLSADDGKRYSTASNETRISKILASPTFTEVRADEAEAHIKGLKPDMTKWIYAVAVGHDGLYGDVVCKSATTGSVSFNALTVKLESLTVGADEASFQVTVENGTATDFIYWVGLSNDQFWKSDDYCAGNRNDAEKYLAANPDASEVQKVMNRNGGVREDGVIKVKELSMSSDHVIVVLAKDESGKYSKAAYRKFTTLAADLGVVVREGSDRWNAALDNIKIEWIQESFKLPENSNMSGNYSFKFSCPSDHTAFILCGSDTYFDGMNLRTVEEKIVYIENYTSRRYDNGYVPYKNGEMMCEPDYYKDGVLCNGQLMNVYDYYVHGLPSFGFATYFATGDHDGNCIYSDESQCEAYQRALERIAAHCTLAPYEERASLFGLKGDEAEAWAQDLLDAYLPFYENAEPIIYYNDGSALSMGNPYAIGLNENGAVADRVIVVLRDSDGNYYEPMSIEVPNYFK